MKSSIIILSILVTLVIIINVCNSSTPKIGCLNQYGESVDWWVIQKQPKVSSMPEDSKYKLGLGYLYADSKDSKFMVPSNTLNDTNALSHTLNQIYEHKNSDSVAWFLYNDQPPTTSVDSDYAHSKGVVSFTKDEGFWLIHSVPRFPHDPNHEEYYYPKNEINNGQSFLCVSYKTSTSFADIAEKIYTNRPYIYAYNLPTQVELPKVSVIQDLIKGDFDESARTDTKIVESKNGLHFQIFAKNAAWGKDLYEDLIQPTLFQNMVVTSWRLGAKKTLMPTFCAGGNFTYDSINSLTFSFEDETEGTINWKYTKDHSKYAISINESDNYICIGDVNRMYSQFKRGGGSACFINQDLWESYRDIIATIDTNCSGDSSFDSSSDSDSESSEG